MMTAGITVALALGGWPALAQLEGLFQRAMEAGGLAASEPARVVAVVTGGSDLPVGRELHVGDRIDASRGDVTVAFLEPCAIERISGGSATIGPFSSDVAGGRVTGEAGSCRGVGVGLGAGVPGGGGTTGDPDEAGVVVVRNFMLVGPRPPVRTVPNGDGFMFEWPGGRGLLTVWEVRDSGMTLLWEDLGRGTGVFYPSAAPKFVVGPVYAVLQDGKYVFFKLAETPTQEIAKIAIGGSGGGGSSGGSSGESQGPGGEPQTSPDTPSGDDDDDNSGDDDDGGSGTIG